MRTNKPLLLLLLCIIVTCLSFTAVAAPSTSKKASSSSSSPASASKASDLFKRNSQSHATLLTAEDFRSLVLDNKKEYSVVVLFSIGDEEMCQICPVVEQYFSAVASSFRTSPNGKTSQKLFFTIIHYSSESQAIYQTYKMDRVPAILYFPPGSSSHSKTKTFDLLSASSNNKFIEFLSSFIIEQSGIKFPIPRSSSGGGGGSQGSRGYTAGMSFWDNFDLANPYGYIRSYLTHDETITYIAGSGCAVMVLYLSFIFYKKPWIRKRFFLLASLLLYMTSMAGFFFNIIRDTQFVGYDRNTRKMMLIYPSSQHQLGAEGYMASVLYLLISLSLFGTPALLNSRFLSTKPRIIRDIVGLGLAAIGCAAIIQLVCIYHFKNRGYLAGTPAHDLVEDVYQKYFLF